MRHLGLIALILFTSLTARAQAIYSVVFQSNTQAPQAGFKCVYPSCGAVLGYLKVWGAATLDGPLVSAGDIHGGTVTSDGALTSGSVSTGAISGTDATVSNLYASGNVQSQSSNTGTATSNSETTGNLTVTGTMNTPGFTQDSNGKTTFTTPPAGMRKEVCGNVTTPVALSTLNTATVVTTLADPAFTATAICSVRPPSTLSLNIDYQCRIQTPGTAVIAAKSGLVGLSASSGQWCAVVFGQ